MITIGKNESNELKLIFWLHKKYEEWEKLNRGKYNVWKYFKAKHLVQYNFRSTGIFRQTSGSFSNLLCGLATFDALFLSIAITSFGLPELSDWYNRAVFQPIMPIVFGLLHTFRVGSVYVTLAVTFERFHAIICPLKHFSWKKYMLPFAVLVAIVYNIPKYFEIEIQVV